MSAVATAPSAEEAAFMKYWLPAKPFATDNFTGGVRRMDRDAALSKRHIELNPTVVTSMLALDLDKPGAYSDVERAVANGDIVQPNVFTPSKSGGGRGHAIWYTAEPITMTPGALDHPKAYAAAYLKAAAKRLGADLDYRGKFTYSPLNLHAEPIWGDLQAYKLGELSQGLTLESTKRHGPYSRKTQELIENAEGRNSTIFALLNFWATKNHRHHCDGKFSAWLDAAVKEATRINFEEYRGTEKGLLPSREVYSTARQVAAWYWKNFEPFYARQARVGAMGGRVRTEKTTEASRANGAKHNRHFDFSDLTGGK